MQESFLHIENTSSKRKRNTMLALVGVCCVASVLLLTGNSTAPKENGFTEAAYYPTFLANTQCPVKNYETGITEWVPK